MPTFPLILKDALLGPRVAFILRGWPGLGRVMQGYSLAKLLLGLAPQQQQTFYSSYSGFKFLKEANEDVRELGTIFPQKSWIGPFDNKEVQEMVSYLIDSKPSAIVIDGEVTLLSVLSSLFVCPIFALANPFDLYNQQLPVSLQSILRAFYVCADAVICGSFFLLPEDITPLL